MIANHRWLAASFGLAVSVVAILAWLSALGLMPAWVASSLAFLFVVIGLTVGLFKLASGPLARAVSAANVSIRWKVGLALATIIALVVFVAIVNIQAMDYMHEEIHQLQELGRTDPQAVPAAVDDLEQTQHGPIFEFSPFVALLGGMAALGLGVGMARSVLSAIHKMGEGMGRIAAGDFSRPIKLEHRDELGALAGRINQAAAELATAREASLALERAQAMKERVTQVAAAQEEERRRISRELHDNLGPSLAALANRLRNADQFIGSDPERVRKDLQDVTRRLRDHIQGIRELIYELRPVTLDQLGLVATLRQHAERFSQEHAIEVSFVSTGDFKLTPLGEVTVLRMVQEALSNVQRHSDAATVRIEMGLTDEVLSVRVVDDGRGFRMASTAEASAKKTLGLLSMRERAELVGGSVEIETAPGAGCAVSLRVPLGEVAVGAH